MSRLGWMGVLLLVALAGCAPSPTPTPVAEWIVVDEARLVDGVIRYGGESLLPEGACLQTQLFADGAPVMWWPINTCVPVTAGRWRIEVPLGVGDAPAALDPAALYTLRAWDFEDPQRQSLLLLLDLPPAPPPPAILEVFPLGLGHTWVYSVTVAESLLGEWAGVITQTVTAVHAEEGGWLFRLETLGHPLKQGLAASVYYAAVDNRLYRSSSYEYAATVVAREGIGDEGLLQLTWPLAVGEHWGAADLDPGYHIWVEAEEAGCYLLTIRTNPDHLFREFCPGEGIRTLLYGHHGSLHDEQWVLLAFLPGAASE